MNVTATLSRRLLGALLLTALAGAIIAAPASAAGTPAWTIVSAAEPTNFKPASAPEENRYVITAINTGGASANGGLTPIVLADTVPAGLSLDPAGISGIDQRTEAPLNCEPAPLRCSYEGEVLPGDALIVTVYVDTEAGEGTVENRVSVSGGGAAEASSEAPTQISSSPAPFGIAPGTFAVAESTQQAGAHPDLTTTFALSQDTAGHPTANLKGVTIDTPPGVVGNLTSIPHCLNVEVLNAKCPREAAVGFATAGVEFGPGLSIPFHALIYNIQPYADEPAALAFEILGEIPVRLDFSLRSDGDYGIRASAQGINDIKSLTNTTVTLWGVPADHNGPGPFSFYDTTKEEEVSYGGPGGGQRFPFLSNPTRCVPEPRQVLLSIDGWGLPAGSTQSASTALPQVSGCEKLSFAPSISVKPETTQADTPAGYEVALHLPQDESPGGLATPDLRDSVVALPPGVVASASLAGGLAACSEAQFALHSLGAASCPLASQIGTMTIETPLLNSPLQGQVFIGTPACAPCTNADAQAGRLIHIYLQAQGAGTTVKLAGTAAANPVTGQLVATFTENPQLPFEDLTLHFKSGPRAPLANPSTCGSYTTTSILTPSSAPQTPDATPSSEFKIDQGPGGSACAASEAAQPNQPSFEAGTTVPIAGSYSPFVLRLARADGTQRLTRVDATLPKGLVGKLAGVPYCSDAAIQAARTTAGKAELANPSCPQASEVGSVDVAAGPGSAPFHVSGHAYLAGPYKGAPISLAIITPAVAGPFDLGTVVVRTALYVSEVTAQIHAVSDPLPTILAGIPLDVRSVALNMDKPNFTLNPTSCDPMQVLGSATSTLGNVAPLVQRFQVGACNALAFKPHLAISLKGGTKRNKNPALTATVTYPKGSYANIARAQVTLPHSEFLDQSHIGTVCTRVQFAAKACPKASIYGHATATTPLLDKPLSGPVYLRSSSHKLPDLVAALNGQINVDLAGRIDTGKGGGIRNTFELVPDAPVSKFVLSMQGGSKGLLVNSENICSKSQKALAHFVGQNDKVYDTNPVLAVPCGKHGQKSKRNNHHRAAR